MQSAILNITRKLCIERKQEIILYTEKDTGHLRIASVSLTAGHTEKKSYR